MSKIIDCSPTVCGVAYNDMPKGWAATSEENTRIYQVWASMIKRCYSDKSLAHSPSYKDCTVCDRWLVFSNFVEDVKQLEGYQEWLNNKGQYSLDKDIKLGRCKTYSPEHCCFVEKKENTRERNAFGRFSTLPKSIVALNEETGEKLVFETERDVERHEQGFSRGGVKHVLNNGFKRYRNFRWFTEDVYMSYSNKTLGVVNCKEIRQELIKNIKEELANIKTAPKLAIVQVEGDAASSIYVKNKEKLCAEVGIGSVVVKLDNNISQEDLESTISQLSNDHTIHGVMLQLPLPQRLNAQKAIDLIPYYKDVDALTTVSQGMLFTGQVDKGLQPCTPLGVMYLLQHLKYDVKGKNVCVIGRSQLFGKPMAQLLEQNNATVTLCHSHTSNLKEIVQNCDCVISATGQPKMLDKSYFNGKTKVAIDVGMSLVDGKLIGDVNTDSIMGCVEYYTKTPNGTGQLTVPMLLINTIKAYKLQQRQ